MRASRTPPTRRVTAAKAIGSDRCMSSSAAIRPAARWLTPVPPSTASIKVIMSQMRRPTSTCWRSRPTDRIVVSLAGRVMPLIVAPSSTSGKNMACRVLAAQARRDAVISDVLKVVSPDTFERPIYAGNAIQVVQGDRSGEARRHRAHGARFQATGAGKTPRLPDRGCGQRRRIPACRPELQGLRDRGDSDRPELGSAHGSSFPADAPSDRRKISRKYIEPIADKLGAAMGASRAAVDSGLRARTIGRWARRARSSRPISTSRWAFQARSSIWPA
jgi:electron transfer flavoprotein alpha subunit